MAKKSTFNSVIYDVGDEVISIYHEDLRNRGTYRERPHIISEVKMFETSSYKYQCIKFEDHSTSWEVSNHYEPHGDITKEKYKGGLRYENLTIQEVTKVIRGRNIKQTSEPESFPVVLPFIKRLPTRGVENT